MIVTVQGSHSEGEFNAILASANRMKTPESRGSNVDLLILAVEGRRQMEWMNMGYFERLIQSLNADSV